MPTQGLPGPPDPRAPCDTRPSVGRCEHCKRRLSGLQDGKQRPWWPSPEPTLAPTPEDGGAPGCRHPMNGCCGSADDGGGRAQKQLALVRTCHVLARVPPEPSPLLPHGLPVSLTVPGCQVILCPALQCQCNREGWSQHPPPQPPCVTGDPGPELPQADGAPRRGQLRRARLPAGGMGSGHALQGRGLRGPPGFSGERLAACGAGDGTRVPLLGAAVVQAP